MNSEVNGKSASQSEETRLIYEEPQNQAKEQPTNETNKKSSKGAALAAGVGGFVAGAAVGAGVSAAAATPSVEVETETEEAVVDIETEQQNIPEPEHVILANSEGIRVAHVDADNFADAFAQARAQVGPGGVFEYNGKLYGTYYEDEWNEMSHQERADYQARVSEITPAHHSDTVHDIASESNHPGEIIPTNAELLGVEPVNNEVHVLGVQTVHTENGDTIDVTILENHGQHALLVDVEGEQALFIDVDNDGYLEIAMHDDNVDGKISENEIHDISNSGLHVFDILGEPDGQAFNTIDDNMPDYINDADSFLDA
ncbi:MAG: hypothetical protein J1F05_02330 [Muribaculaceae bacterium]|nr:hypothetical protein [Muribaculaceae bacterium]